MNGKIRIKKPNICQCVIKIDNKVQKLSAFKNICEIELPYGVYKINVGIEIYDTGNIGMDTGRTHWSDIEWAWEKDRDILVDQEITNIKIKRKWHLFRHITTEANIKK